MKFQISLNCHGRFVNSFIIDNSHIMTKQLSVLKGEEAYALRKNKTSKEIL